MRQQEEEMQAAEMLKAIKEENEPKPKLVRKPEPILEKTVL